MRQNMNASQKPLLEEVKHGINAAIECGIRVKSMWCSHRRQMWWRSHDMLQKRYRYPLYRDDAGR